jgi:hypothetical protein
MKPRHRAIGTIVASMLLTPVAFGAGSFAVELVDPPEEGYYFHHRLAPGGTAANSIVVSNPTEEHATVILYPADPLCSASGGLNGTLRGVAPTREGTWVTTDRTTLELKPGEKQKIDIHLQVGDDATPGDHFAFIFVELAATTTTNPDSPGAADTTSVGVMIRVNPRFGVLVWDTVPGEGRMDLRLDSLRKRVKRGALLLDLTVHNSGNLFLKPNLGWTLRGPRGRVVASQPEREYNILLPDHSYTLSFPVQTERPLIRGEYTFETNLRYFRTGIEEIKKQEKLSVHLP